MTQASGFLQDRTRRRGVTRSDQEVIRTTIDQLQLGNQREKDLKSAPGDRNVSFTHESVTIVTRFLIMNT